MSIVDVLTKAHYVATELQVELLARDAALGAVADGTYLRVVTVAVKSELKALKRAGRRQQLAAINRVHARFYPHVLKGVDKGAGKKKLTRDERSKRGTFARTSASTLRYFVTVGGDVRKLDPATVTKTGLRAEGEVVPAGTRAERSLRRHSDAMIRAARRVGQEEPDKARSRIEGAIEALQAALAAIPEPARRPRKAKRRKARAEAPKPAARPVIRPPVTNGHAVHAGA